MQTIEKAHETRDVDLNAASRGVWLVKAGVLLLFVTSVCQQLVNMNRNITGARISNTLSKHCTVNNQLVLASQSHRVFPRPK